MIDTSSVFNLIRGIDQRKIDSDIYQRCVEVDKQIQQGEFQEAIRTAKNMADQADRRRRGVATTAGIAHLYLALSLHMSNGETERDYALAECNKAIMQLRSVDDYCHAIAEISQAYLSLEHKKESAALEHYRNAIRCLDGLITQSRRQNELRREVEYIQLQREIRATIQEKRLDAVSPNLPKISSARLSTRRKSNDLLSINSLLSLLQLEHPNDTIFKILSESEIRRHRGLHQEAIALALEANKIAQDASDRNWKSVTLLHLSATRILMMQPEQDDLAIHDCEQAIRFAGFNLHNLALSQIIRAQIELQIRQNEDRKKALFYFRQAEESLGQIIKEKRSPKQDTSIYQELQSAVESICAQLIEAHVPLASRHTVTRQIVKSTTPRASANPPKRSLGKPDKLLIPIFSIAAHAGFPGEGYVDNAKDDFLDIRGNKVFIENRPYEVRWLHNKNRADQKIQLQANKEYIVVQVEGKSMEPTIHHGEYLLVRKQSQHDSNGQLVVAALGNQSEFDPFRIVVKSARGYPTIEFLESHNSDKLRYPIIEPSSSEIQINLLGVVEAVLHPTEQPDATTASARQSTSNSPPLNQLQFHRLPRKGNV